jgi:hypothetical protein
MKFLLREPLVHFLLIGAALFLLFGLLDNPAGPQSGRIVITAGQIDYLKASFTRTWQRSPSEQELQGLIDSYVRDEMFYREALAMGLDRDDMVIRRRLKQKLEIMSEDLAAVAVPSDDDLREFMETHPDKFRSEPQVTFRHVFLNYDTREEVLVAETARLLAQLSTKVGEEHFDTLGDKLMLPRSFDLYYISEITRLFGEDFSRKLMEIEPGQWVGPINSGYGLHLVSISERIEGRLPKLAEVRKVVEREWLFAHSKELKEGIHQKLREKYTVVFELPDEGGSILPVAKAQAASEGQK